MSERDRGEDSRQETFDEDEYYVIDEAEVDDVAGEAGLEPAAEEAATEDPAGRDELERLRAENAELRNRALRLRADFENFRKRMEKEKEDFYRYALAGVIQEVLPIVDNFERALASEDRGEEFARGVELIHKQLADVLRRLGMRPVEADGALFDPNLHEAVAREENPDLPSHTITQVLQPGYLLHDRLIRPAMVKVALGGPEAGPAATADEESVE